VSPRERRPDRRRSVSPDVEFFIDRSLGRKHLAGALLKRGFTAHTMASVYGETVAQGLEDEQWLKDAGRHGWVVLMKDDAIRRRPSERDALAEAGVRAFCLTNANLRAAQQTARFVGCLDRILRQAAEPGPYIYGVYEGQIRRLWP
jgi:PIN like domain